MQALIDFIVKNLLAIWPVTRIDQWEHGLVVRGGHIQRTLGVGLHWRWPFVDVVKKWPANLIALDLPAASVTTRDGKSVAVSANLGYRVTSISLMWLNLWNSENTLAKITVGELASYCAGEDWAHLASERRKVETEIVQRLNERCSDWGILIESVRLTDLVATRGHRHYVDGMAR